MNKKHYFKNFDEFLNVVFTKEEKEKFNNTVDYEEYIENGYLQRVLFESIANSCEINIWIDDSYQIDVYFSDDTFSFDDIDMISVSDNKYKTFKTFMRYLTRRFVSCMDKFYKNIDAENESNDEWAMDRFGKSYDELDSDDWDIIDGENTYYEMVREGWIDED